MNLLKLLSLFLLSYCFACSSTKEIYKSASLKITKLTPKTYIHETYLQTEKWGKVGCNGLIYVNNGEAIIFDTPTTDSISTELINWVENHTKSKVKALVINHFHADCLGGIGAFHKAKIPSYANQLTLTLATKEKSIAPLQGFDNQLILKIGGSEVINQFFGEAHTKDNIVSYIPSEKTLFGGCMVKTLNAGKGNVADANEKEWSNTITKVKKEFPKVKYVIPGHGKFGDSKLLDFTISLFK